MSSDEGNYNYESDSSDTYSEDLDLGDDETEQDEAYDFKVVSAGQVCQEMDEIIDEASGVLQVPRSIVAVLLNHFKWDKDVFMEQFFSDKQQDIMREAKVVWPIPNMDKFNLSSQPKSPGTSFECDICLCIASRNLSYGQECGHIFCLSCWKEYLTAKIMDEGMGQSIRCPSSRCDILVDNKTVLSIVQESKVVHRYHQLIANTFIQCNKRMKFCPAPNCFKVVKVTYASSKAVHCSCGHAFCFGCSDDVHVAASCHMLEEWYKKLADTSGSETDRWILLNTRNCPKCKVAIQKSKGCNHMTCSQCEHEFCWICLTNWSGHGDQGCLRYKKKPGEVEARAAFQRYIFYSKRYSAHKQSLSLEQKLCVEEKISEAVDNNGMAYMDVVFLKKAVTVLCQSRRTLMNTSVFAFFLDDNSQKEVFVDNQSDFHSATGKLSELIGKDLDPTDIGDFRLVVMEKMRYCETRCNVLLDHVEEGWQKSWWSFSRL